MELKETRKRGRKALDPSQKKVHIQFYIEKFKIDALGGVDKAERLIHRIIEKLYMEQ